MLLSLFSPWVSQCIPGSQFALPPLTPLHPCGGTEFRALFRDRAELFGEAVCVFNRFVHSESAIAAGQDFSSEDGHHSGMTGKVYLGTFDFAAHKQVFMESSCASKQSAHMFTPFIGTAK